MKRPLALLDLTNILYLCIQVTKPTITTQCPLFTPNPQRHPPTVITVSKPNHRPHPTARNGFHGRPLSANAIPISPESVPSSLPYYYQMDYLTFSREAEVSPFSACSNFGKPSPPPRLLSKGPNNMEAARPSSLPAIVATNRMVAMVFVTLECFRKMVSVWNVIENVFDHVLFGSKFRQR